MSKHNLSIKKIKKQILSINDLIESNFNKLKYFKSNYKKILLNKNNRVFYSIAIVVILTLSYLLIPSFYNKGIIQSQIKNQIFKNYNIEIIFNEGLKYSFLPKPHFYSEDLDILRNKNKIGNVNNLKIFIGINKFFSINKVNIKDLVFQETDFNIYLEDFLFFKNLLNIEPNENKIFFNKSNIFFKNRDDEILFINKIKNSKFYFDYKNLVNVLNIKNEVFNIPFKLKIKNDKFNKETLAVFDSNKIRLNIENDYKYGNEVKNGQLDILFISKNVSFQYSIKKNILNFSSDNGKNNFKGKVEFKPFYLRANFNYEGISSKNIFDDNSIIIDLINSEILNNKNLTANLSLNVKNITNINELNNLNLKILIEEGNINFSESKILWKDNLKITLSESFLNVNDDGANLVGTVEFDFEDINNFYSSFQIKKIYRKDINQIKLDFTYNLNSKNIRFDNPKINNIQNKNLDKFLNKFNSMQDRAFNKITFKNFINNFFSAYAG